MQKDMFTKGLVLVIIVCFIVTSIAPSLRGVLVKKQYSTETIISLKNLDSGGNTLYVGGGGSGNYSNIQSAIDDAGSGDTVFVYDDSSPYYENVVVDKAIDLIGKHKDTTIIDAGGSGNVVYISADWVNISGFTIQNSSDGICLDHSSYNNIIGNNINLNNRYGIRLLDSSDNNIIHHNIFTNNTQNAYDECTNTWDDNTEGNYWSDYNGSDGDGDGIGDIPYNIPGGSNQDRYPLGYFVNIPPFADANGPYAGTVDEPVQFDSSGSFDPDGTTFSYDWDFGDGESSYGANPTHIYDAPGIYDVSLTVEDDDGDTDTDTTTAEIFSKPIADANGPYEGIVGIPIEFHGSASEGVPPYSYNWSFGDNTYIYEQNPSYTYDKPWTYKVSLKVTDNRDVCDADSTFVVVKPVEELVADADGPYSGYVDEIIQFYGICVGGTQPYSWYWEFGDGNTSTIQNPTHTYATSGSYTAKLIVTDTYGTTDDDTAQITVGNHPPNKPTITGPTYGKAGTSYTYTFYTVDPDGDDVRYIINWGDGFDMTPFNPSGMDMLVTHIWPEEGIYIIRASAEDTNGLFGPEMIYEVNMPKSKAINRPFIYFIENFFEMFPNAFPILQKILLLQRLGLHSQY